MKSLLIGIGVGLIISLFGSVIVAASVDKNAAIRVFLGGMGIILLTIGSLTFLIHHTHYMLFHILLHLHK